jgi:hypothetical protein
LHRVQLLGEVLRGEIEDECFAQVEIVLVGYFDVLLWLLVHVIGQFVEFPISDR